jgi:predicted nucleic acid-binding protein
MPRIGGICAPPIRGSVPVIDALLAAMAQVHDLVLVTRNTADVSGLGVRTLNPFDEA